MMHCVQWPYDSKNEECTEVWRCALLFGAYETRRKACFLVLCLHDNVFVVSAVVHACVACRGLVGPIALIDHCVAEC